MANYTTTITNEGAALLASVIANQGTLTFNEFRFSENDYTGQELTLTEGTFLGVFITASAAASVIDSTTIKTSAQFNNSTITGNHNLYSIGIVGTDGNTTALIAVCTTTDPDVIREPLTGTSTYAFNVNLSVSDTSQINVFGTTAAVIYDTDVIDTLISTATDKPLSANMGKKLADEKQDKTLATPITVDGTQETTVEGALGGLNDYGDSLEGNIEAIVDVYGAKNQLDDDDCFSIDNMDKSGHTFTSNNTDTRNYFDFHIDAWDGTTYIQDLVGEIISSTGHYEYSVSIPNNANRIRFVHNGSQRNIGVIFNTSVTGTCIISLDVTGVDPTTVGGLSFENIMIRDVRITDPTYEPYAKTNQQLTANVSGLSNRNLLDNGWFTVNQRGITSATIVLNTYYLDRWFVTYAINSGTIEVVSGGIKLTPSSVPDDYVYIKQRSEIFTSLYGKAITASVLLSDGTIKSGTITRTSGETQDFIDESNIRIRIVSNNDFEVRVGTTTTIRAVKLEIGTVSTLHLDVAPDYTTELLKCQRYFYRLKALLSFAFISSGIMGDATTYWGIINLPVPMRATPQVTNAGSVYIRQGTNVLVSGITCELRSPNILNIFAGSATSLTAEAAALLLLDDTSSYIDFSADL